MTMNHRTIDRRSVLRTAVTGLGAAMITAGTSGCATGERNARMPAQETAPSLSVQDTPSPRENGRILLAYFSRAGENYYYGGRTGLNTGNTEVLARMISKLITCDVHRIEAVDHYVGVAAKRGDVRRIDVNHNGFDLDRRVDLR